MTLVYTARLSYGGPDRLDVAGMTIPLVRGGLSKALLPAEARAALGEP